MSDYHEIYKHYEDCLEKHGPNSNLALDWPTIEGMITRYKVMADLIKDKNDCLLLDLGCGTGAFCSYLATHYPNIKYSGADISNKFVELCKKKYPKNVFYTIDLTDVFQAAKVPSYDYIIMNGIFTAKYKLSQEQMFDFLKSMLYPAFAKSLKGLAFNVMSEHVDCKRDDLFHLSHDQLANFIVKELKTRNFIFRNDYGLYEYTTYIYK